MEPNEKDTELQLNEPKNQIIIPKTPEPPIKPGYDYIWGSDQDELNEKKED